MRAKHKRQKRGEERESEKQKLMYLVVEIQGDKADPVGMVVVEGQPDHRMDY